MQCNMWIRDKPEDVGYPPVEGADEKLKQKDAKPKASGTRARSLFLHATLPATLKSCPMLACQRSLY